MRRLYKKIKKAFGYAIAWWLDYMYVVFWQLYGFLVHSDPKKYMRQKEAVNTAAPILLIPGIYEDWQFMKPIADMLYAKGHAIHVVEKLGYNVGTIEAMALLVQNYIAEHALEGCIIAAHSKGGLVGKYALVNHNQTAAIKGMIALHTPFAGSRYAQYVPIKGVRIFKPTSPDLSTLQTNTVVNAMIVSIYGTFDPHIPGGSYIEGARNIQLETKGHFKILRDKRVLDAVALAVDSF